MRELKNETVLITGGTSGIGEAFARRLAADGYDLVITGRRVEKINRVAEELQKTCGVKVEVIIIELSDAKETARLVKKVSSLDNLSMLINNAGFNTPFYFSDNEMEVHEKMVNVHLMATMKLTHAALPGMLERGKGAIINVSSVTSLFPLPTCTVYGGTKSFLNTFSECLHLELRDSPIKIQALNPGFIRTDFFERPDNKADMSDKPYFKWMSPEEVVRVSLNKLRKKDKVIVIPGAAYRIFGRLSSNLWKKAYYFLACLFYKKASEMREQMN